MTDPGTVMAKLDSLAAELDELSKALAETERQLEPVEAKYEEWLSDYEANLWEESQLGDQKFPPEKLRLRMAHRAMAAELLGSFNALRAKRKRLEQRIGSIRVQVDAQRSILSALKTELEASR